MKTVVAIIVLFVGFIFAYDYVSKYAMGGIESGMHGGGDGKYADYHDNNFFAYWLSDYDEDYRPSESALNPFAETHTANCGGLKKNGVCSCQASAEKAGDSGPVANSGSVTANPFNE